MEWKVAALVLVGLVLAFGLGMGISHPEWFSTSSSEGEIGQPIWLYGVLIALILGVGFLFSRMRTSEGKSFSLRGFFNVAIAGVLVGGVLHEFTHSVLLQHATQFRVHFGDPGAIFSTCCLLPGELPHEEIAYAVQFIVMLLWLFLNRSIFLGNSNTLGSKSINPSPKMKNVPKMAKSKIEKLEEMVEHEESKGKKGNDSSEDENDEPELTNFAEDKEWDRTKKAMESALRGSEKNGSGLGNDSPRKKRRK